MLELEKNILVWPDAISYSSNKLQHTVTHCNTLIRHSYVRTEDETMCCSVLQCVAVCCSVLQCVALTTYHGTHWQMQHTATHCNTLQHTVTHCNTRQHTATYCNTLQYTDTSVECTSVCMHAHVCLHACVHIRKYTHVSTTAQDARTQRETERQRDRKIERQRDRETERQRDWETERLRDWETERQRDRETERQTDTLSNLDTCCCKSQVNPTQVSTVYSWYIHHTKLYRKLCINERYIIHRPRTHERVREWTA